MKNRKIIDGYFLQASYKEIQNHSFFLVLALIKDKDFCKTGKFSYVSFRSCVKLKLFKQ